MMFKGEIVNEFGEVLGRYWFRSSTCHYALSLYHGAIRRDGLTEEGLCAYLDRLGLTPCDDSWNRR